MTSSPFKRLELLGLITNSLAVLVLLGIVLWRAVIPAVVYIVCLLVVDHFVIVALIYRSAKRASQANLQAQDAIQKLVPILNSTKEGIYGLDLQGCTTFSNKAALEMTGHTEDEMIGVSQHSLIHHTKADGTHYPREECNIYGALAKGIVTTIDNEIFWHKDGHAIPVEYTSTPIKDESGRVVGAVVVFRDITERKRVETERRAYVEAILKRKEYLSNAKEEAEKASRSKSEFLANMSHEVRTPLNGVLGMLSLLKRMDIGSEERHLVDGAYRSSTNLLNIVNDILNLSKIEAGVMQLESIGMDLARMVTENVAFLLPLAQEKHTALTLDLGVDKLPYVLGDPTRLNSVLTNIIGNAIKYTSDGSIQVLVSHQPSTVDGVEVSIRVKDTGIGIAPEMQDAIFKKFIQADASTTRKYGGTGLGLAITKELVELMGGRIGIESIVGVGSTFSIILPFKTTTKLYDAASDQKVASKGTIPVTDARILVAEDHLMNQMLMTKLLQRFKVGYFEIVDNGLEAVQKHRDRKWDVILMDCHMPEMNGYDATKEIRLYEQVRGYRVPIVAMTANAMVGDREKCLSVGMDDYISKPIDIDNLCKILEQWIIFDIAEKPTSKTGVAEASLLNDQTRCEAMFDTTHLRSFSEGDREIEKKLVIVYLQSSEDILRTLEEALAENNERKWYEAAHMLKGGAANVGATTLSLLCDEGQSFTGNRRARVRLYERIVDEYAKVKAYLIARYAIDLPQ